MKSNIVQVVNCLCLTVFSTWSTHGENTVFLAVSSNVLVL